MLSTFGGQQQSGSVIHQPFGMSMNQAAIYKYAQNHRPAQKLAKETLLEQAHLEYQRGDYANAELHCKQVILSHFGNMRPWVQISGIS